MDQATRAQFMEGLEAFVRGRLRPHEDAVERAGALPEGVKAEMRAMGLYGLSIPEEFGGLGLNAEEEVEATIRIAHVSPAFRSEVGTNNGLGSQAILAAGTGAQKAQYLPKLAAGMIGAFALTEPDSGSDAASLKTTARRDGDHYVLNGTKRFISHASDAGLFVVMARTDPAAPGPRGISAFIVERDAPGLSAAQPYETLGLHGSDLADLHFDDCRVPASALLGGVEGGGFRTAMATLDRGRLQVAAACVGNAERLIEEAATHALTRRQFGAEIGSFQLVQAMLAESEAERLAGRSMVLETARALDRGEPVTRAAAACKLFCSEMVGRVADRAVQIHGGYGWIRGSAVERFYRDVRIYRLYEGTSEIQKLVIARDLLREWRERL
jgi:acyl-CoA dehydrogenase